MKLPMASIIHCPMMKKMMLLLTALVLLAGCKDVQKWSVEEKDGYNLIRQEKGPVLGYSPVSGVPILTKRGLAFKDLNRNGKVDVYEDWRRSAEDRARDLASQLSIDEIAGLMLYSDHQAVPGPELTDEQRKFLAEDNLRAVLITRVKDTRTAAIWNNNMQAFVEGVGHGIPGNTSSDPRNGSRSDQEYLAGAGGDISRWPSSLGMAATFDPDLVEEFGRIASQEYRALGIATALSPQVDLATEPRWNRFGGTYGEDSDLAADMARAYCDGFQTSPEGERLYGAWGWQSVNAMVKHWYGYGAQEAGRDSHFAFGKFAVYPGGNLAEQKKPFVEGAFRLRGGTGSASAVMPVYSILWHQDPEGTEMGGSYSDFVIQRELREAAGFEGVVCTDWHITYDNTVMDPRGHGKPWGVEDLTVAERHYRILSAGVDQFGGNNDKGPVLEAYEMWKKDHGEESARKRFEQSAYRLVLNVFRVGLFENPYLDPEESARIVGNPEFMAAGFEAQRKAVIMVKNHNQVLPVRERKKVYLPQRHYPATPGTYGGISPDYHGWMIRPEAVSSCFDVVDDPAKADLALVGIKGPSMSLGYDTLDVKRGGNGYVPISLQYDDYKAVYARAVSLAGGDPLEDFTNRTYKDKVAKVLNRDDMVLVQQTRRRMGAKPVVVVIDIDKPIVLAEIEPYADAVLLSFEVSNQAVLDLVSGKAEPSGLLPMQLPANMKTVEEQLEDLPKDMECYRDADGHTYDFAYGLNWSGVIDDARVKKYR